MEVGIWSTKVNMANDLAEEINRWMSENKRAGMRVVDKIVKMSPQSGSGSSFSNEPWVCITVWMEKSQSRGIKKA